MSDVLQGSEIPSEGSMAGKKKMREKAAELGVGTHLRHIFLCCDQSKPKCCSLEQGLKSWDHLKSRLHDLELDVPGKVFRTKANCLRVCANGPIALVMPDNVWYHSCTPKVLDTIIDEHLLQGKPVEEFRILPQPDNQ